MEKKFNAISSNIILCSGTVIGNCEKIKEYLSLINSHIAKYKYKKRLKYFLTMRVDQKKEAVIKVMLII